MKRLAWSLLSKLYSAYVDPKLKESGNEDVVPAELTDL